MLEVFAARYVKKFVAGLLWNCRTGADLEAVLEAPTSAEESLIDCRIVKAMVVCVLYVMVSGGEEREMYLRR